MIKNTSIYIQNITIPQDYNAIKIVAFSVDFVLQYEVAINIKINPGITKEMNG